MCEMFWGEENAMALNFFFLFVSERYCSLETISSLRANLSFSTSGPKDEERSDHLEIELRVRLLDLEHRERKKMIGACLRNTMLL